MLFVLSVIVACLIVFIVVLLGRRDAGGSFSSIRQSIGNTIQAFPATIGYASAAAVVGVYASVAADYGTTISRIHFILILGISLSFALSLCSISAKRSNFVLQLAAACGLAALYFLTRTDSVAVFYTRIAQLCLATHLLVAISLFVGKKDNDSFWNFNAELFVRFLIATGYVAIIYIGIAIAVVSFVVLLDLKGDFKIYSIIFFIVLFLFHPLIFLSGLRPLEVAKDGDSRPALNLDVLTRRILIPLMFLYLAILYLYLGKIILTATLPKGYVGWLVCGLATLGTLTYLIAFPLNQKPSLGSRIYLRYYFLAILPLLVLLVFAAWERTHQYGITERRYLLWALTTWLIIISVYHLISYLKNGASDLRIIPSSLLILAVITSCGPWGAYQTSLRSQLGRLQLQLTKAGIDVVNGTLPNETAPAIISKEVTNILEYLISTHGVHVIQNTFKYFSEAKPIIEKQLVDEGEQGRDFLGGGYYYGFLNDLLPKLKLEYLRYYNANDNSRHFNISRRYSEKLPPISVGENSYFVSNLAVGFNTPTDITLGAEQLQFHGRGLKIAIFREKKEIGEIDLTSVVNRVRQTHRASSDASFEELTATFENESIQTKVYIQNVTGNVVNDEVNLTYVNCEMYIKLR